MRPRSSLPEGGPAGDPGEVAQRGQVAQHGRPEIQQVISHLIFGQLSARTLALIKGPFSDFKMFVYELVFGHALVLCGQESELSIIMK